jgi:hypothetical protein
MPCLVLQDCSIQISPISDPTCSDPFSTIGHPYGAVQQTAYYMADGAGGFKIESRPRNSPSADGISIRQVFLLLVVYAMAREGPVLI